MGKNVIKNEYLMFVSAFIISFTYWLAKADGELTYALSLLLQYLIPIVSVGLFYVAFKVYQNQKYSIRSVMLISVLAMLVALMDIHRLNEVFGRFKIFAFVLSPILVVEVIHNVLKECVKTRKIVVLLETVIVFTMVILIYEAFLSTSFLEEPVVPIVFTLIGGVWAYILNLQIAEPKRKNLQLVVWSGWLGMFTAFTVLLASLWENDYWVRFHLCVLNAILLVGFPVLCIMAMKYIWSLKFETEILRWMSGSILSLVLVLAVMWLDHITSGIYMRQEQMNMDRSLYYLILANLIVLSSGTWKQKVCRGGVLNIGVLACSPLLKELKMFTDYVSTAYPWDKEARYFNTMVFISESYGLFPLALMTVFLMLACVALITNKEQDKTKSTILRVVAAGYGVRLVLVLVQWWFKFPHIQVSFPFCGTSVLDIVVLWILLQWNVRTKEEREDLNYEGKEKLLCLWSKFNAEN